MAPRNPAPIILASASPRRRQILKAIGILHEVRSADVDEKSITAASPREFALKAALLKATAFTDLPKGTLVIAADTIVVLRDKIYFKPLDRADAVRMLTELSGNTHQVITALAVHEVGHATQLDAVKTYVKIRELDSDEIKSYVDTGEPMDKAGSYGIQGIGARIVENITGDYFNVVGLPAFKLVEMLESHVDVSAARQKAAGLTPALFTP